MADPYVRQARNVFTGLIGSTDIVAGDMVYFDDTDWELADATTNLKYAEAIAVNSVKAGDVGNLCTSCVIVDTDAPHTIVSTVAAQYLSASTAGDITSTRPTGNNNLAQVVGYAVSTTEVVAEVKAPHEQSIWVDLPYADGSAAVTVNGDWAGLSMTANADAAHGVGVFPQNTVGLVAAFLWSYVEDLLAGGSYTIDVSAGVNDEAGTAHTDGIGSTVLSPVTADDLVRDDVTAAFNGGYLVDSGNHFGVDVAKASETTADDYRFQGVEVVVLVV
jgi:hypothetical protein